MEKPRPGWERGPPARSFGLPATRDRRFSRPRAAGLPPTGQPGFRSAPPAKAKHPHASRSG